MGKAIIGIHGLNNKPAESVLSNCWLKAIAEGLTRNGHSAALDRLADSAFMLAYWRQVMYDQPIPSSEDPEPYRPADGEGPLPSGGGHRDELEAKVHEGLGKIVEETAARLAKDAIDEAIRKKAVDVERYRSDPAKCRAVQDCLKAKLEAAHRNGHEIMLIAHSMGSFVAYDVLANRDDLPPDLKIAQFVTLGSPLGLEEVKSIVRSSLDDLRVPKRVEHWTNFADPKDPVALDWRLESDYKRNEGGVEVVDDLVTNAYRTSGGKTNHHKIYGYLRTPEMSQAIAAFLADG